MAGDIIAFYVLAFLAIAASIMVMEAQDIFHGALYLALVFASVAGLFILLTAEFLAAIQILVYAGAVLVLILFAIVFTRRDRKGEEVSRGHMIAGVLLVAGLVALLLQPLLRVPWPASLIEPSGPNTYSVGLSLFTDYVIPFEIVSLALLAALIGAVYLSKREVGS